jgi:hypothetical protein
MIRLRLATWRIIRRSSKFVKEIITVLYTPYIPELVWFSQVTPAVNLFFHLLEYIRLSGANVTDIFRLYLSLNPFSGVQIVRKLGIFSFNLIQKISAIYVMTCMCMCV